ncbi:MAG: hypothetical protein MJ252_03980, partial [archaeon]|nr:hypothetical protein [archaeon]
MSHNQKISNSIDTKYIMLNSMIYFLFGGYQTVYLNLDQFLFSYKEEDINNNIKITENYEKLFKINMILLFFQSIGKFLGSILINKFSERFYFAFMLVLYLIINTINSFFSVFRINLLCVILLCIINTSILIPFIRITWLKYQLYKGFMIGL